MVSSWTLWTCGVTLHWLSSVYLWQWRLLLPVSAVLELAAFLIFFRTVSGHRPQDSGKTKLDEWIFVVIAGSVGLLLTLLINFGASLFLALRGNSPELPANFDQRFLVLQTWGFLVPFVWGFSAKWLPIFLGLQPVLGRALLSAVALNSAGVLAAFTGWMEGAVVLLAVGIITASYALRLFEATQKPPKVKGVHSSFLVFVRLAYVWALVAAILGVWAASARNAHGMGSLASRAHRWLSGNDGICGSAAAAPSIFRNAIALQHQAYVPGDADSDGRMPSARQL